MRISEQIKSKLVQAFAPDVIEVLDESEKHRGHAGHRPEGESHFRVTLRAESFGPCRASGAIARCMWLWGQIWWSAFMRWNLMLEQNNHQFALRGLWCATFFVLLVLGHFGQNTSCMK